jgi:phage shock protein PspC (stress-responsive transcriptional regulator)
MSTRLVYLGFGRWQLVDGVAGGVALYHRFEPLRLGLLLLLLVVLQELEQGPRLLLL